MSGYISKFPIQANSLTMREVRRIFQLDPAPPPVDNINEYIAAAVEKNDLQYFLFFLHHFEQRLNGRISSFLLRESLDRYDPERFLDYKQSCVLSMLECLNRYAPGKSAEFATYVYHPIGNALLRCRMMEEGGSFSSLDEYKMARGIAWLYNKSDKSEGEVVAEFAKRENCSKETAQKYLALARTNRSRISFYGTAQDEDGDETGEDVTRDDSWDYVSILWNGLQADTVRTAFEKLTYREQRLLEERNAVCMTCGRASPLSQRKSFEKLAVMFEGSSTSGAERAYRKAVEKLTVLLVESGALHAVRVKRKSVKRVKKRITTAVYEYQADCDGEWGEIQFDFENGTAEVVRLAEWDTMASRVFAERVMEYIMACDVNCLPQRLLFAF